MLNKHLHILAFGINGRSRKRYLNLNDTLLHQNS